MGRVVNFESIEDPALDEVIPSDAAESLRENGGLAMASYPDFDLQSFRSGDLTPVYFGSALRSFGWSNCSDALADHGPPPQPQPAKPEPVDPTESRLTGLVFKVQATWTRSIATGSPSCAFARKLVRGMKVTVSRTRKVMAIHNPITFFARDRELAEGAVSWRYRRHSQPRHSPRRRYALVAGDVAFTGLPDFAPEFFAASFLATRPR